MEALLPSSTQHSRSSSGRRHFALSDILRGYPGGRIPLQGYPAARYLWCATTHTQSGSEANLHPGPVIRIAPNEVRLPICASCDDLTELLASLQRPARLFINIQYYVTKGSSLLSLFWGRRISVWHSRLGNLQSQTNAPPSLLFSQGHSRLGGRPTAQGELSLPLNVLYSTK